MECSSVLITSAGAARYDLGDGHPMRAVRATLSADLATELGILSRPGWWKREAEPATSAQLQTVHTETYVQLVERADHLPAHILAHFGLGTEDTPVFPGMHAASAAVVGATLAAVASVWAGEADHAVNLAGGLHHAMPGHASGFCVYNDAAVGIAALLESGAQRVAYVDLDAHHGDGVEACFADDPRVLTISLHQDGRTIFPGSGAAGDIGGPNAKGTAINIALPPGTGDVGWLRAFHAIVPAVLRSFRPDVIVTQCGCDAHVNDPLTDLEVTVEGFTIAYTALHELAHELCEGRWIVLGGGGYDLGDAVPRAWAQLLAVCNGGALPNGTELPEQWRKESAAAVGGAAPRLLGDGVEPTWRIWPEEHDPFHPLDVAVAETHQVHQEFHPLLTPS
jgi:acetoin utilization protein AcuC